MLLAQRVGCDGRQQKVPRQTPCQVRRRLMLKRIHHRDTESTAKTGRRWEQKMWNSMFLSTVLLFSLCPLCLCGEPSSLDSDLTSLAKAHKGKVAIAMKHLENGETFFLNADDVMPTASLIKLPI